MLGLVESDLIVNLSFNLILKCNNIQSSLIFESMSNKFRIEKDCLNCGKDVESRYCSYCSQANTKHPESLGGFIRHFFEDLTHFDTGIFISIRKLLFSPGELTNIFNSGQRKRFLHPIRMYIFTSIIVFAFFNFLSHTSNERNLGKDEISAVAIKDSLKKVGEFSQGNIFFHSDKNGKVHLLMDNVDYTIVKNKILKTDGLNEKIAKTLASSIAKSYKKNPNNYMSALWDNYLTNLPKTFLLLMPIFSLLLALIYFRRRSYFMNHLVFSLHFHTAVLFVAVCIVLCSFLPDSEMNDWLSLVLLLSTIYHLYASMKRVYQNGNIRTLVSFIVLIGFYFPIILIVNLLFLIYFAAAS